MIWSNISKKKRPADAGFIHIRRKEMIGTIITFGAGAAVGAYFGPQVRAVFKWGIDKLGNIKFGG